MLFHRASSVYVIPVDHTYIGCFGDKKGDRDMLLVPKVRLSDLFHQADILNHSTRTQKNAFPAPLP